MTSDYEVPRVLFLGNEESVPCFSASMGWRRRRSPKPRQMCATSRLVNSLSSVDDAMVLKQLEQIESMESSGLVLCAKSRVVPERAMWLSFPA